MNEIITLVIQLISTVGFPIAAYVLIFFSFRKDIKDLTDKMNENTIALTKLISKLEADTDGK